MKKFFIASIFLIVFVLVLRVAHAQEDEALKRLGLEIPKVTKNNVKITKLDVTSVQVGENNTVQVQGTFELKNYSNTPTTDLYFSSTLGVRGMQSILAYPLLQEVRSDTFILKGGETITKNFSISQEQLAQFSDIGVEIKLFDSYNKTLSIKSSLVETVNENKISDIATSTAFFWVDEKELEEGQTPIFNLQNNNIQIKIDQSPLLVQANIEKVYLKIYQDTYHQAPIQIIEKDFGEELSFEIPKDTAPGRYPFEISFVSKNQDIFVPRIYSEFIIDGNLNSVTEVSFEKKGRWIDSVTATIKGYGAYGVASTTDQYEFETEFILTNKEGQELWRGKVEKNSAWIFKNIDLNIDEKIKLKEVSKIKVNLIDENGEVFDSFEKEVIHEPINIVQIIVFTISIIAILILLILVKKYIHKNKEIIVGFLSLLLLLGVYGLVEMATSPLPMQQFGYLTWDNDPEPTTRNCTNAWGNDICGSDINQTTYTTLRIDPDLNFLGDDLALELFNVGLYFDDPIFKEEDPTFCYNPGEVIPFVSRYEGPLIATNHGYITNYIRDNNWFTNFRGYELYPTNLGMTSNLAFDWNITSSNPPYYSWGPLDLTHWMNNLGMVEIQSSEDFINLDLIETGGAYPTRQILNINAELIREANSAFANIVTPGQGLSNAQLFYINTASPTQKQSLIAPEKPGTYDIFTTFYYAVPSHPDGLIVRYASRRQISVCNKSHDADFTMQGHQYVDTQGVVRDKDGAEMGGYTVYSPTGHITSKFVRPQLCYPNPNPYPTQQICGYDIDPVVKFSFLTIANYCGSLQPVTGWNNNWVNLYANTPVNTRAGFDTINNYSLKTGFTRFTLFAYRPYLVNGNFQYYQTTASTSDPTLSNANYDWYVHNEGGILKFINLQDVKTAFNNVLDLNVYGNIPRYTLSHMLTNQLSLFNVSSWLDSSNNTSNTYIVKETIAKTNWNANTTCSIYEDFCPTVPGIQYIFSGSRLELWNLVNGQRILATSTVWNASQAQAQAMCNAVPASNLTVSCSIVSPINQQDRKVNTPITFVANTTGIDSFYPTVYSWSGVSGVTNQPTATTSYSTTGVKNDVSITVTNGTNSVVANCSVEIVPEVLDISCSANPPQYILGQNETSKDFTFSYTASQSIASQAWKDSNNITKSTNTSYIETISTTGTHERIIYATSTTGAAPSASCFATLQPFGSDTVDPDLDIFEFRPNFLNPPDDRCPFYLNVTNVTSCKLINLATNQEINIATTSPNTISTQGTQDALIGTWNLSCTGLGVNAQPQNLGIQKCISNPTYQEN